MKEVFSNKRVSNDKLVMIGQIRSRFNGPADVMRAARQSYHIDMWANQPARVEVWIEKEALVGVIEPVCRELDLPYLACRGYVSQSEQWRAYRRLRATREGGQRTIVLHFGDHDPSGVDMTRDNRERLEWFLLCDAARALSKDLERDADPYLEVRRMALTMEQIDEYDPPPNPAKDTDARFKKYAEEFGDSSWELDALEPDVIVDLIRTEVDSIMDHNSWDEKVAQFDTECEQLDKIINDLE